LLLQLLLLLLLLWLVDIYAVSEWFTRVWQQNVSDQCLLRGSNVRDGKYALGMFALVM
jgi:hypothetical protein